MRLFEAIVEANHRALAGDAKAGLRPAEFAGDLPIVALTCIDVRLNPLLPEVLGVPESDFIWLRNAGNIITGPLSSTMRSLALACAIKGGKEIAIIGHTDCQVGKTSTMQLLDAFRALGIGRHVLPDNLAEFFGTFGSDRQNVIRGADIVRNSPLIGPKVPVHGLLVDITSGKLEWLVNGYETAPVIATKWNEVVRSAEQTVDAFKALADFHIGDMKFPDTKIGDAVQGAGDWLAEKLHAAQISTAAQTAQTKSPLVLHKVPHPAPPHLPAPGKMALPPQLRPRINVRSK